MCPHGNLDVASTRRAPANATRLDGWLAEYGNGRFKEGPSDRRLCLLTAEGLGEGVGGGAVEVVPGPVVAAGGAGVAVAQGILDVLRGDADGECFGGEAMAQAVRLDQVGRGDAGGLGEALDQVVGGLVRQWAAGAGQEDRPAGALTDQVIECATVAWGRATEARLPPLRRMRSTRWPRL